MRGALPALLFLAAMPLCADADTSPQNSSNKPASFDEIVVVATKRETGIRDVAADVTVLDDAFLESTLSTSLADTFRFVPGVTHDEARLDQISELAHDRVDRWLEFVDQAEPVPQERRAQLAADDLARRRNIAERDPANVMGVRFFGEELTDRLVRSLWGGDRELPRPT